MAERLSDLYREHAARELCSICAETALAVSSCLRCGIPLCAEHRHEDDQRCARCELEYIGALEPFEEPENPDARVNRVAQISLLAFVLLSFGGLALGLARVEAGSEWGFWLWIAVTVFGLVQLLAVMVWRAPRLGRGAVRARERFDEQRRAARRAFLDERLDGYIAPS